MRHSELSEGVSVLDDNGNVVGTSKVAARHVRMLIFFRCSFVALLTDAMDFNRWPQTKRLIFLPSGTFRDGFDQNGPSHADSGASPPDHDRAGKVRDYIFTFLLMNCSVFSILIGLFCFDKETKHLENKGESKTAHIRTRSAGASSTSGTSSHLCGFGYAGTSSTSPDFLEYGRSVELYN